MVMSKYFSNAETTCKDNCGFDIQPGFARRLDELRDKVGFPLVLTSAARCPIHNAKVGGAPKSKHMEGIAADIDTTKLSPAQRYNLLKSALELGFTVGINAVFLHVDTRPGDPLIFTYAM